MINLSFTNKKFIIPIIGIFLILIYIFIDSIMSARILYYRDAGEGTVANELAHFLIYIHVFFLVFIFLAQVLNVFNMLIPISPKNAIELPVEEKPANDDFKLIDSEQLHLINKLYTAPEIFEIVNEFNIFAIEYLDYKSANALIKKRLSRVTNAINE